MNNCLKFGIVQGRLSKSPPGSLQWFPIKNWQREFEIARNVGINYIELISEISHNPKNPIWENDGIEKIKSLVKQNSLCIHSLCNDYIIENSFLDKDVIQQTTDLLLRGKKLGIKKYILPFLGQSEISLNNICLYKDPIINIASLANSNNINLCLETTLPAQELIEILDFIGKPTVKIVFDTGNRVAKKLDLADEIRMLGDLITHVHIKDKNIKDENVLLGTGLVNFESVFFAFKDINYNGPYTFETTRGSDPLMTAKYNINLVNFFINHCNNY